ncbi:MAG: thioredoxin domain-containing protein [Candidatus Shapirobacteria bacterium]
MNEIKISFNTVLLVVLMIVGLVGTSGYFYGKSSKVSGETTTATPTSAKPKEITIDQVKDLFNDKNIAFGNKDSKLLFVEFSDPSCPYCHVAAGKNGDLNKQMGQQFILKADGGTYVAPVPEMKKLVDAGIAAYVWIYANGHGNGELATVAQYCAQEKGKFWEVHDLLMSDKGYEMLNTTVKTDKTKTGVLADFLDSAVKSSDMKACIDSGKYESRLTQDMAIAKEFGFQGTPSFFVNTTNFSGAYSFTDMQVAIDGAK